MLSERDREEIDANAKQMIRELNSSIRALEEAEQLRRETESAIIRKQYGSGFGALGAWASGGTASSKTEEHAAAEGKAQVKGLYRQGILLFLRHWLEGCCRTQQNMIETRLARELDRNHSSLAKAEATTLEDFIDFAPPARRASQEHAKHIPMSEEAQASGQGLTEDQIQMFEEGNQDMMKQYEGNIAKVRYVISAQLGTWGSSLAYQRPRTPRPWLVDVAQCETNGRPQNRPKVASRDLGIAIAASQQLSHAVGAHRTTSHRLFVDDGQCGWGQQRAEEGNATTQHGPVYFLRSERTMRVPGHMGSGDMSEIC